MRRENHFHFPLLHLFDLKQHIIEFPFSYLARVNRQNIIFFADISQSRGDKLADSFNFFPFQTQLKLAFEVVICFCRQNVLHFSRSSFSDLRNQQVYEVDSFYIFDYILNF